MKRMASSNVLIVGVQGLGVEIGEPGLIFQDCANSRCSQERRPGWREIGDDL